MQFISDTMKSILEENGYIGVTLNIVTTDRVSFTLTSHDLVAGSFSINRNSISGSDLEIGNVETSELKFKINNADDMLSAYKYEGAEVTVIFNIGAETLLGGKYIIDNKPTKSNLFEITALDAMAKFNKKYASSYSSTTTIRNLIVEACVQCGVTCSNINRYNLINTVVTVPNNVTTTYHEVIGWCAEIMGVNAFVNQNGELTFGWYGDQQIVSALPSILPIKLGGYDYNGLKINITSDVRYDYTANEDDITLTGVMLDDGTNPVVLVGTSDLAITISNNPLIIIENASEIIQNIYTRVCGFTYRPCKIKTNGYPNLWQMDIIDVTAPSGETFQSIISNHTYTLNGLSVLAGTGKSSTISSYASPSSQFTSTQVATIKRTMGDSVETSLSAYDAGVMNASSALNSSAGFYETKILDSTGKILEYYQHDQPTLAESLIVTKITEGYVGKSIDGGVTYITSISAYGATIPQLTARTIYTENLVAEAITSDKIKTGAITTEKLEASAITSDKIQASAITSDKIQADAITSDKIQASAITSDKIQADAITADKVDITTLSAISANLGTIVAGAMLSSDEKMKIDLTNKNISMTGFDSSVEMSLSNPLRVNDSSGTQIAGLGSINGEAAFFTPVIADSPNDWAYLKLGIIESEVGDELPGFVMYSNAYVSSYRPVFRIGGYVSENSTSGECILESGVSGTPWRLSIANDGVYARTASRSFKLNKSMDNGNVVLSSSGWTHVNFATSFDGVTPSVTLTPNTTSSINNVPRVANVTATGFDAIYGGSGVSNITTSWIAIG